MSTPQIRIRQWPTPVSAGRASILDAALAAGVPFPHGCRSGECGQCKCRVLAGAVEYEKGYAAAALSAEERAAGLILACRSRVRGDVELAWLSEVVFPVRRARARVTALERVAHDVSRLRLALDGEPLAFAAGQYARLRFGGGPARPYSMANVPGAAELEFHIRHLPGGAASSYVAERLAPGDKVRLEGPFGTSHLREAHAGPLLAVAGGTGLAPVLAIVRTALARDPARAVRLYWGVRDERDVYAEAELRTLAERYPGLRVEIVLSAPSGPGTRRVGYVHQALAADVDDFRDAKLYVCGPPPMVQAVGELARTRGLAADDLHSDPFPPAPPVRRPWWRALFGGWRTPAAEAAPG